MPSFKHHIAFKLIFWLLIAGALSYEAHYLLGYLGYKPQIQLVAGITIFTLLCTSIVITFVHFPFQKIVVETKALLTGKSYKRIPIHRYDELGMFSHFFNEVTRNLEEISTKTKSAERIQKELNTAQKIQENLLPKNTPHFPELDIHATILPASEIGGDVYNYSTVNDRHFLYIGDSTGHGIPAGIIMVMVDLLIDTFLHIEQDIASVLVKVNRYLKPHLETTRFMTLGLFEWLPQDSALVWAGAGHEYVLHVKTTENRIDAVQCGGIALGMVEDNSKQVKTQDIKLTSNDFVVLYSDGITEAKNVNGEPFGIDRLKKVILSSKDLGALGSKDLFKLISDEVAQFMEGQLQDDDITLLVIKKQNPTAKNAESDPAGSILAPA